MTPDDAYTRLIDALRAAGSTVSENGTKAQAQCPAHDDGHASLSVGRRRDGLGALVYCHAGCQIPDIVVALDLSMADLFDDPAMRDAYSENATRTYPGGRKVHRKPGKKFHQSGNKADRSLFGADRVTDTTTNPVYVVEGEKDVLAAQSVGAVAVCSAMGAGKAHLADWTPLAGRQVIIVADKDDPGRKHARQVAQLLADVAGGVQIVEAAVGKDAADHIAAGLGLHEFIPVALDAKDIEVDGAQLLNDVSEFAGKFFAFPTPHYVAAMTLWILHTWAVSAFYVTPRLVIDSPEPGCGKTRVLEVLVLLCRSAKLTLSATTASLYRRIAKAGDQPPTILQDEADAVFGSRAPMAEDLRALFNAGYKRGATVDRCEGDAKNIRVQEFPVFAPVALAGLAGKMSKTVLDRAVVFHMRHRAPGEKVAEFRERDAATDAAVLRSQLDAWSASAFDALAAARPNMPAGVEDRAAEVWEALLAVADVADPEGDWPERARAACRYFVLDAEEEELSLGVRLLRDIRRTFESRERMFSVDIVTALTGDPEMEWADLWGKPLDQARLAKELKRYGVRSHTIRIGNGRAKGYAVDGEDGLAQAWERYLPSAIARDTRDTGDAAGQSVTPAVARRDSRDTSRVGRDCRDAGVTSETIFDLPSLTDVTGVTDVTPINGREVGHTAQNVQPEPPPGALTPDSLGQTERMKRAHAAALAKTPLQGNCSVCGEALWASAAVELGLCDRCRAAVDAGPDISDTEPDISEAI